MTLQILSEIMNRKSWPFRETKYGKPGAQKDAEKDAWPMESFDEGTEEHDVFMARGGTAKKGPTTVGRAAEVGAMLDAVGLDED